MRIRRSWFFFACVCLLLTILAAGCGDLIPAPNTGPREPVFSAAKWQGDATELPFACAAGNVLLNVRVAQHDYVMLLDTGAICSMASPQLLKKEAIKPGHDTVCLADMAGSSKYLPTAVLPGIRMGAMQTAPVTVAVRDLSTISETIGTDIDLVGGLSLFRDLLLSIDYPSRKVRLARGSLPEPDGREVLRLQLAGGQRYLMPVTVAGCEIWATPDTGCTNGLVCPSWAETLFPGARETPRPQKLQFWEGRGNAGYLALKGELRVGSTASANPVIVLAGKADPVVGYQLMDSFEVTLDQTSQRIRFHKTRPGPLQLPGPLTTGIALAPDARIVALLPGSSADRCGLRIGDRVLQVNSRAFTPNSKAILLPQTLYDKLNLTVDRNGKKVEISLMMTPMPTVPR